MLNVAKKQLLYSFSYILFAISAEQFLSRISYPLDPAIKEEIKKDKHIFDKQRSFDRNKKSKRRSSISKRVFRAFFLN